MKQQNIKHGFLYGLVFISLPMFIFLTNPNSLPLPLLILPFFLLFICLFMVIKISLLKLGVIRSTRKASIASGVAASLPVLLLIFQTVHQLSVIDVLVSVCLATLTTIYITKTDFIR